MVRWQLRSRASVAALTICGLLCFAFVGLAGLASRRAAPTFDEPLHAAAAWTIVHRGDFRVNPEDPPLWQYWAALPNGERALRGDTRGQGFEAMRQELATHWWWVTDELFRTPGVDGDSFIRRSRAMMLMVAAALGLVIAGFSWKLGGGVAAVGSLALYALDPNFLGHGALVKNDVAFSLALLGVFWAMWCVGRRATWVNVIALALLCGVGLTVKFSGVLLIPMLGLALLIRVAMARPWDFLRWRLDSRLKRLAGAVAVGAVAALASFAMIWAVYQFRFSLAPAEVRFNERYFEHWVAQHELALELGRPVTEQQIEAQPPSRVVRLARFANRHRLLPHAYLMGFLYTHGSTLARESYLHGEIRGTGWWYYFPLAMLYKTPVATLVALAGAVGVGIWVLVRRKRNQSPEPNNFNAWTLVCLGVPAGFYLLTAMRANVNLGLRHVLPVYPFLYIAVGVALACLMKRRRTLGIVAAAVIGAGLLVETLIAYPNYIGFFNVASVDPRAAARRLGDSNLDWGQDLLRLAEWQAQNRQKRLYLSYFGTADPGFYGIRAARLPGGYRFGPNGQAPPAQDVTSPGALAMSVTNLQGLYLDDATRQKYQKLFAMRPTLVVGRSIWIYEQPEALNLFRSPGAEAK